MMRSGQAQDEGGAEYQQAKFDLGDRLAELNNKMNSYLANEYGKNHKQADRDQWKKSHQPFHWVSDFYGIIEQGGGFDVVIGNPPYVEYSKLKKTYTVKNYATESCGNLYAFFVERNKSLLSRDGNTSMIIPHSAFCTDRMASLINMLAAGQRKIWISSYSIRPAKLFADAEQRLSIYLQSQHKGPTESSNYLCWRSKYRPNLLRLLKYQVAHMENIKNSIPKCGDNVGNCILNKVKSHSAFSFHNSKTNSSEIHFHNAPRYWIRATDFIPYFWNERDGEKQSVQVKNLKFNSHDDASAFCALINSALFYWWFIVYSDCRHLNMREIENFPFNPQQLKATKIRQLSSVVTELMESYREHSVRKETRYQTTGKVVYDEFYPRHSKHIIDKIDTILAKHYNFTEEELDYIINYDIKYRMSLGK